MSYNPEKAEKPHTIRYAENALWVWTAWVCLFGIYQSWINIPQIEELMAGPLQGLVTIEPQNLLKIIIAGYVGLAVLSAWIIVKIGAGRHWARSSLMWGFILDAVTSGFPPYHLGLDLLANIPDFGLQTYALYYLYSKRAHDWFQPAHKK